MWNPTAVSDVCQETGFRTPADTSIYKCLGSLLKTIWYFQILSYPLFFLPFIEISLFSYIIYPGYGFPSSNFPQFLPTVPPLWIHSLSVSH